MSHHKINVKDSEKSPKVLMNNWSLDVILGKEMARIDKSEKTVVNGFTMEQKILHKRYKNMMHQSKLSHARITKNHEMEKELRSISSYSLNTNVGHLGDGDDMLKKVWDYGNRCRSGKRRRDPRLPPSPEQQDEQPDRIQSAPVGRRRCRKKKKKIAVAIAGDNGSVYLTAPAITQDGELCTSYTVSSESWTDLSMTGANGENHRPDSSVSVARRTVTKRPITAVPNISKSSRSSTSMKDSRRPISSTKTTSSPNESTVNLNNNAMYNGNKLKNTESPSGQFLRTVNSYLEKEDVKRVHRPKTTQALTHGKERKEEPSHSLKDFVKTFCSTEPGGRPNLLDVQKVQSRIANYKGQVSSFSDWVAPLKADSSAITDYYTSRLMEGSQKEKKHKPLVKMTEPPEHELQKELGDTKIKSLTMKLVDLDFENRPSTFVDVSAF